MTRETGGSERNRKDCYFEEEEKKHISLSLLSLLSLSLSLLHSLSLLRAKSTT